MWILSVVVNIVCGITWSLLFNLFLQVIFQEAAWLHQAESGSTLIKWNWITWHVRVLRTFTGVESTHWGLAVQDGRVIHDPNIFLLNFHEIYDYIIWAIIVIFICLAVFLFDIFLQNISLEVRLTRDLTLLLVGNLRHHLAIKLIDLDWRLWF